MRAVFVWVTYTDQYPLRIPYRYAKSDCNHLYINSVPIVVGINPGTFAKQLNPMILRYAKPNDLTWVVRPVFCMVLNIWT